MLGVPALAQQGALRTIWRDAARSRDIPVLFRPAPRDRPAPTVILSHGLGGTREGLAWLAETLPEAGYAALSLQHPGSDETIFGGGPANWRSPGVAAALTPPAALDRLRDVAFAIAELARRATGLDIDPTRFAVAGHSYGAWTVQHALGQRLPGRANQGIALPDPRVLAGIAISPVPERGLPPLLAYGGIRTPLLSLTGSRDAGLVEGTVPEDRREIFDATAGAPQVLAILDGADHLAFAGEGPGWLRARGAAYEPRAAEICLLFLDAFVKRDPASVARLGRGQVRPPLLEEDVFEAKGF
jgi:dienelactone hydrolase